METIIIVTSWCVAGNRYLTTLLPIRAFSLSLGNPSPPTEERYPPLPPR